MTTVEVRPSTTIGMAIDEDIPLHIARFALRNIDGSHTSLTNSPRILFHTRPTRPNPGLNSTEEDLLPKVSRSLATGLFTRTNDETKPISSTSASDSIGSQTSTYFQEHFLQTISTSGCKALDGLSAPVTLLSIQSMRNFLELIATSTSRTLTSSLRSFTRSTAFSRICDLYLIEASSFPPIVSKMELNCLNFSPTFARYFFEWSLCQF
mmetsp:Transcript_21092/g.30671  ORF Transcript_21092/g.30671 Transcript_21092/m.30671 type:complete len:209 (-) Transcript_21092:110-736(-)